MDRRIAGEPRRRSAVYSPGEELANTVTHAVGMGLSLAGLALLVVLASLRGNVWHIISSIVFGVSLVVLYTNSTFYHGVTSPRAKRVFKLLDHSSIYLLIAGSYTPFALVTLRESAGWWLFGAIWGIALIGVIAESAWLDRPKWVSAAVFLAMGWLAIFLVKPLAENLPPAGFWLLVAGGITYSAGTAFYVQKRIPFNHAIWHLFVLGGSVCHLLAVLLYVIPVATGA